MFKSLALYTTVDRIVRALGMQAPEFLTIAVSINSTSITVNQVDPNWQIGMSLMIDANNPANSETLVITSITALVIGVTPLVNSHIVNAPVINVTQLNDFIGPASRWFDGVTQTPAGFAYESVTETKQVTINRAGYISVPLSKPLVVMNDVVSMTFQPTPMDPIDILLLSQGWIVNNFFLDTVPSNNYCTKTGMATITYQGGFNPLPLDIIQAVTVMTARFYKEKDSGYSDIIGMSEMGIMSYKKAMPADVKTVVDHYTRWVV